MEGNRRLILYEPGPLREDTDGEEYRGEPVERITWGLKRDRGGSEGIASDTQVGNWETSFRVRWLPGIHEIGNTWWIFEPLALSNPTILAQGVPILAQGVPILTERAGKIWDIEYVNELPIPRRRWLILYCVSREGITTRGAAAA